MDAEEEEDISAAEKAELLAGMAPPADPTFAEKAKSWSWLWGVGVFALFMIGAVLLFWDDMHVKKATGRPEVPGAAIETVKEEAEEFGTTVAELATEIQEEAQEESREAAGLPDPSEDDAAATTPSSESASAAETATAGGDDAAAAAAGTEEERGGDARHRHHRRLLFFTDEPAKRFLVPPPLENDNAA